jgi:hypothetical protein
MMIIARLGGSNGIEIVADDERTEQSPTPEWIEDTAHRLARVALEVYGSLPDSAIVTPDGDDD